MEQGTVFQSFSPFFTESLWIKSKSFRWILEILLNNGGGFMEGF